MSDWLLGPRKLRILMICKWRDRKASGMISILTQRPQNQECGVPAQQRTSSPFLHLVFLVRTLMDQLIPTCIGKGDAFYSIY